MTYLKRIDAVNISNNIKPELFISATTSSPKRSLAMLQSSIKSNFKYLLQVALRSPVTGIGGRYIEAVITALATHSHHWHVADCLIKVFHR